MIWRFFVDFVFCFHMFLRQLASGWRLSGGCLRASGKVMVHDSFGITLFELCGFGVAFAFLLGLVDAQVSYVRWFGGSQTGEDGFLYGILCGSDLVGSIK